MNRVIILGSPGSGKSTFARHLASITGLALHHLDMIWHNPDRTTKTREEFSSLLGEILQGDSWIIDGNYSRTLDMRLERCDTVFLLDYPLDVCLAGAQSRIGTKRPDLPWVETEMDKEFYDYILAFPRDKLGKLYECLEAHKDKEIHIFKAREEADVYLKMLENN